MPPQTLPNLYCLPSDVMDYVGTDGAQLALDDHSAATGRAIQATAVAVAGATSIAVTEIESPLLAGTTLEFDGAGMAAVVEVVLTATAKVGDLSLSVAALPAQVNALATATDNGVNAALAARLVKACRYGTDQVKLYLCSKYDDSQLALSQSCNRWATSLACRWLLKRRLKACPQGLQEDCEEAVEEMKAVRVGQLALADVPTRYGGIGPFVTNVTVDVAYTTSKVRVQEAISEGSPVQFPRYVDWDSALWIEW